MARVYSGVFDWFLFFVRMFMLVPSNSSISSGLTEICFITNTRTVKNHTSYALYVNLLFVELTSVETKQFKFGLHQSFADKNKNV